MQSAKSQMKAIATQQERMAEENRVATSTEMFDRDRQARREQARILTAAGEAGLSLNSGAVENMLLDSAMQQNLSNQRSLANMESRIAASDAEANSMRSKVASPTLLGAGLQIAGSVASNTKGLGIVKEANPMAGLGSGAKGSAALAPVGTYST